MNDYRQPDFYRFNQDSLKLVNWIVKQINQADHILDLGAGSGVIGIELANIIAASELDLLEVQSEYVPFLKQNILEQLSTGIKARIITSSFGEWRPARKYDLVVCNPPFFLPNHGEASQDERRNIARSFVIDNWVILLKKIEESLKENGKAFLVVKANPRVLEEIKRFMTLGYQISIEGKLAFIQLFRLNID